MDVRVYSHGGVIRANDIVVRPIIWLAMPVVKNNARGVTGFVSKVCGPVNYSIGDREFSLRCLISRPVTRLKKK